MVWDAEAEKAVKTNVKAATDIYVSADASNPLVWVLNILNKETEEWEKVSMPKSARITGMSVIGVTKEGTVDLSSTQAEATLYYHKATADINRIRLRSNLTPLAGTATMKDLYHERRCELAFEFTDHLFDLKRWNRSSNTDIKTLADKELNAHPRIRRYEDRANPESAFTIIGYEDYTNKNAYQAHMMVFPYPSEEITKSNGQLKQNEGY